MVFLVSLQRGGRKFCVPTFLSWQGGEGIEGLLNAQAWVEPAKRNPSDVLVSWRISG